MEPPPFPGAHSVQHLDLVYHDDPARPTHPKSMLRGHAFRCHVGDNGGGGDGGGGDGGVGGGESAGAVMAAQPQAPHLLVHDQLPMLPPPSFAHCLQHLSLVCHDGLALPLQPKVG